MKFHVIVNASKSQVLCNVYEKPFNYSEYTSGGDSYYKQMEDISEALDNTYGYTSMLIFKNEEAAYSYMEEYVRTNSGYQVIKITDLES